MQVRSNREDPSYADDALLATTPDQPGAAEAARIPAGVYSLDPEHTLVTWAVNHMGFSILEGQFPAGAGSIKIDPAKPALTSVNVVFDIASMSVGVPTFAHHLGSSDMFDMARYPTARFVSTSVENIKDGRASVAGELTLKGVTRQVTLDAAFVGAGINPMTKKLNFGFSATAVVRRSEFGLGFIVPVVSDHVRLRLAAAFAAA